MDVSVRPPASGDVRSAEAAHLAQVYAQFPFEVVSGEGAYLTLADGRRLLDLYGGHAVCALGYGHPRLTQAIRRQAGELLFASNAVALRVRARAADKLAQFAPPGLDRVFFVNSGAEANENALRLACKLAGRSRVVALEHGFHGRTAAAGAVTWGARERWYGFPNTPFDVAFAPRDNAAAAASHIDRETAAVILEPIQGLAGAYALSDDFLRTVRDACDKHGALLIADEVQCGMGRSGLPFAISHSGVAPDMITAAKSLGAGVPCAALLMREECAAQLGGGDLGTTFGGGPLACAAIEAVLDAMVEEQLPAQAAERERQIRATCVAGPVTAIEGRGLLLGLKCAGGARQVRDELLAADILTGTSALPQWLRLMPPLNLREKEAAQLGAAVHQLQEQANE
ncbi:MAG: aminotransferase class III-fold pyridoxal phosphate-dependent enzyme [Gammaproteobacteria bacterium]|nr:aminotransferase class III-fold pyridoxal phosphate-dependent enzyme [Gammaproteobacteria bacterium]